MKGTPLHWAVRQSCFQACKILLDNGADPLIIDTEGYTTLHIAAQLGYWPILALILSYNDGDFINVKDKEGRTPIMMALSGKQMLTTRVLCALGAKLNAADKNLNTVLHHAVLADFAGGINTILSFVLKHTYSFALQKSGLLFPPAISFRKLYEFTKDKNEQNLTPVQLSKEKKFIHCTKTLERFTAMIPEDIYEDRHNQALSSGSNRDSKNNHDSNPVFNLFDTVLYKLFGNFSSKQKALLSYLLPTIVLVSSISIINASNKTLPIWPFKVILLSIVYIFTHYVSSNILTSESNKYFPIGMTSALKIFGMGLGLIKYSKFMHISWILIYLIACPFTWYCLYRCALGNPGLCQPFYDILDKSSAWSELKKHLLTIYYNEDSEDPNKYGKTTSSDVRICTSCMVRKPLRSKHCGEGMLDHCVGRFDHYCPWVINAIGYQNHQWFLGYLIMALITCGNLSFACAVYWMEQCNATEAFSSMSSNLNSTSNNLSEYQQNNPFDVLYCDYYTTTLAVLMSIFGIWVFLLLSTQLWMNIVEGSTTNESINFKRYAMGNNYPVHGNKECQKKDDKEDNLVDRAIKAKQFMPLKTSMSARFIDLFRLRRRNIDWSKSYTEDDLVNGGLLRRVMLEV